MEFPTSMSSTFTTTRAPTFNGEGDFAEYERDVCLWSAMTDIAALKKGAAVLGGLSGPAKDFCATLSLENVVLQESGVEAVLNHLRNGFAASNEMQLQSDIASFLDYFRTPEMTVSSFVVGYQSRLARLKSIALPPEIQGHLLLRQGGFDRHTQGLIVASASGSFKLDDIVNALKGLYGQTISMPTPVTSLPNFGNSSGISTDPGSMYSKGPNASGGRRSFCSHCHKVGHSQDTCWAFMRANGMSDKADALEATVKRKRTQFKRRKASAKEQDASVENVETFYTSLASPSTASYHVDNVPSAILDTGAVGSIIGKEVLDRFMEQLALTSVRTVDDSRHRIHKFGTNGEPLQRLFTCELPWKAVQTSGESLPFKIVVDVLPGEHPFLLGFPTLKRMSAQISFDENTLAVKTRGKTAKLRIDSSGSHPRIVHSPVGSRERPSSPGLNTVEESMYVLQRPANFRRGQ
jgi:hypothetical protein